GGRGLPACPAWSGPHRRRRYRCRSPPRPGLRPAPARRQTGWRHTGRTTAGFASRTWARRGAHSRKAWIVARRVAAPARAPPPGPGGFNRAGGQPPASDWGCTPATARPEGSAIAAKLASQAIAAGEEQAIDLPPGTVSAQAVPG